ncbi:putative ferric reductase [Arthrobacter sp. CAN_A2]|uniref:ferredoxin reductase family protein n=1 Tax=Arthrobacter sp. CAN_A2 TaxID=2787718 RepID=UPI0018F050AD
MATDLVVVMLLLAARVPFIDRTIGHDGAIRRHGALGKPVLYLLLAHGVLLTLGYAMTGGIDPAAQTAALWAASGDMQLAYLGLGLFCVVAVTSLVAVRRRFPHEVWHAIHLLTYAAVAASLPHQFSAGGLFSEPGYQRWYWLALLTVTGSAVLVYRVLVPLLQTMRYAVRVTDVHPEGPGTVSITMTGRRLAELDARAGQFFNWRFLDSASWWQSHPYSLSAPVRGNTLRITVRDLGRGSRRLAGLRPGTRVALEGPYGVFTEGARTGPRLVLVASGIGVSPVRAILEEAAFLPGDAVVILRASTPAGLTLRSEIEGLCTARGARLHCLVGPRHADIRSWLPAAEAARGTTLRSYVPSAEHADLYVCGAPAWTALVEADAAAMGFTQDSIHVERFAL